MNIFISTCFVEVLTFKSKYLKMLYKWSKNKIFILFIFKVSFSHIFLGFKISTKSPYPHTFYVILSRNETYIVWINLSIFINRNNDFWMTKQYFLYYYCTSHNDNIEHQITQKAKRFFYFVFILAIVRNSSKLICLSPLWSNEHNDNIITIISVTYWITCIKNPLGLLWF